MKRIIIYLLSLHFAVTPGRATIINWIGSSASNWNNNSNWSSGTIPGPADDVIFNVTATIEMDILPATTPFIYLINSLSVTGNASVTLSRTQTGGGTRILQVKSTAAINPALKIDPGSSLTINAANSSGTLSYLLDLTGTAAVTGLIAGNLYFTGTGVGTGDAHLNIYSGVANYANLIVQGTGVIKYFANTGNTSSAPGSSLAMESGSTYEINKNGGSVPFGTWNDNSTILISGATANGSITFSQSQYGNLEWNTPLMSAVTQLISALSTVTTISVHDFKIVNTNGRELRLKTGAASAATPYEYTVRNNLEIGIGGILVITGINVINTGAGARLHLMGNLVNGGILKSDGASGTVNDFELNGITNQTIANTGSISGTQLNFIMNNVSGVTLLTPLSLPGTTNTALQLNNGKITTMTTRILTMADNAGYSGGSSSSFVDGPMIKTGDDAFSFPVGKGSIYAPVNFSPAGALSVTDAFQAEYFRLNPQSYYGANYESTAIDHISYVEYWQLKKIIGSTAVPVNMTLTVTPYSFAKDMNSLSIAVYDPANLLWRNTGVQARSSGIPSPPYITGTITSISGTQSGILTLASGEPYAINPLPVYVLSFEAQKKEPAAVMLRWELGTYCDSGTTFEIQRSDNGSAFVHRAVVSGNTTTRTFSFYDDKPIPGLNMYRLKIRNGDGTIIYSRTASIKYGFKGIIFSSVFPDPVRGDAMIRISTVKDMEVNFRLYHNDGRPVRRWKQMINSGTFNVIIPAALLPPGLYILTLFTNDTIQTRRFIKQ